MQETNKEGGEKILARLHNILQIRGKVNCQDRSLGRLTDRQIYKQTDRLIYKQTDRRTDWQTDIQTDRRTDGQDVIRWALIPPNSGSAKSTLKRPLFLLAKLNDYNILTYLNKY